MMFSKLKFLSLSLFALVNICVSHALSANPCSSDEIETAEIVDIFQPKKEEESMRVESFKKAIALLKPNPILHTISTVGLKRIDFIKWRFKEISLPLLSWTNHYYQDEVYLQKKFLEIQRGLESGDHKPSFLEEKFEYKKRAEIPDLLNKYADLVLIKSDRHGTSKDLEDFLKLSENPKIDWIAMEMFSQSFQEDIDIYLKSDSGSKEFLAAEKKLKDYLELTWDSYFTDNKHSYFEILVAAKKSNKKLIALDARPEYLLAEENLDSSVQQITLRNYVWAKVLPRKGRGIVLGGGAHLSNGFSEGYRKDTGVFSFIWFAKQEGQKNIFKLNVDE